MYHYVFEPVVKMIIKYIYRIDSMLTLAQQYLNARICTGKVYLLSPRMVVL
jgi:hypothetical protein